MTDNPLVEAVAKGMAPANWQPFDPKIHGSPVNQKAAQVMWLSQATTALRAIEDAGWKVVPVELTQDMENAAYEAQVKGADLHDFQAFDCAKEIWCAMLDAAPNPTVAPNHADQP